ncbi:hypothetical protein O181_005088 [Austropuccinia psidii MF-1]|uniref:Uncharacterized protein n=1 Tax=Austropuccinia psidii MF-1 TaxID=1389203 RepID=A0A9Q3BHV4_9BASI|nr:hypothetical protein [Austropuccinia psidii MF-1]
MAARPQGGGFHRTASSLARLHVPASAYINGSGIGFPRPPLALADWTSCFENEAGFLWATPVEHRADTRSTRSSGHRGNSGIGYVTALELSRHGAKTYLACRDQSRARAAIEKIKESVPGSDPQFLQFDLTSLKNAYSAAQKFLRLESRLDILINNAGVACTPYNLSDDGIEVQACNGTGHFAFTVPLLPLLEKTSQESGTQVRIINVTSDAHTLVWKPDFSSLAGLNQKSFGPIGRYGNSKLSIILFTKELQEQLKDTRIICISVHPGGVHTQLGQNGLYKAWPFLRLFSWLESWVLFTPEEGAITQLYAATEPEVQNLNLRAAYLRPFCKRGTVSKLASDKTGKLGKQFWNLCEGLLKEKLNKVQVNY